LFDNIIHLLRFLQRRKVEVIILQTTDEQTKLSATATEIDNMLKGSISRSLLGVIENKDMTIDEIRAERVKKYEYHQALTFP
jgi:Mrp family chromosome partitioning ATPase